MGERHLEQLAVRVGRELLQRQRVMVTAESCTGGWVAQAVTAIAGSSAWFDCGFVTYSNAAKQRIRITSYNVCYTKLLRA